MKRPQTGRRRLAGGPQPARGYFGAATPALLIITQAAERNMADAAPRQKTRERRDELSRDIYEIRTKIDSVVAWSESP